MNLVPTAMMIAHREAVWREAIADAETEATQRLREVGTKLGLAPDRVRVLVHTGLEIARQFAAQSAYANYEHRTGQSWPDEWRELDEKERQVAWRLALQAFETRGR